MLTDLYTFSHFLIGEVTYDSKYGNYKKLPESIIRGAQSLKIESKLEQNRFVNDEEFEDSIATDRQIYHEYFFKTKP